MGYAAWNSQINLILKLIRSQMNVFHLHLQRREAVDVQGSKNVQVAPRKILIFLIKISIVRNSNFSISVASVKKRNLPIKSIRPQKRNRKLRIKKKSLMKKIMILKTRMKTVVTQSSSTINLWHTPRITAESIITRSKKRSDRKSHKS